MAYPNWDQIIMDQNFENFNYMANFYKARYKGVFWVAKYKIIKIT